ncbi:hypothetical protein ILYODFUR_027434 [Ilyodon furcidens]|uniref:Uncharacterized protein n=1 Tax=Ilyodon furcidens TaxID=33524 RepID=A0ABV0VIM7_9TELE
MSQIQSCCVYTCHENSPAHHQKNTISTQWWQHHALGLLFIRSKWYLQVSVRKLKTNRGFIFQRQMRFVATQQVTSWL